MSVNSVENNATARTVGREMIATRVFDAPRELVFRMWTDSNHIAQWWGPKGFRTSVSRDSHFRRRDHRLSPPATRRSGSGSGYAAVAPKRTSPVE